MASNRFIFQLYPNTNYTNTIQKPNSLLEFQDSDLFNIPTQSQPLDPPPPPPNIISIIPKKFPNCNQITTVTSSSLPLNVPDWSKILKDHHKHGKIHDDDEEYDQDGTLLPPHEYLARRRGASFSVHEGFGRTLKGRDLSRVRNAIWKKTGFED